MLLIFRSLGVLECVFAGLGSVIGWVRIELVAVIQACPLSIFCLDELPTSSFCSSPSLYGLSAEDVTNSASGVARIKDAVFAKRLALVVARVASGCGIPARKCEVLLETDVRTRSRELGKGGRPNYVSWVAVRPLA